MKETIYPKEFTWESLGCKDDDASLTLLHAEIAFYETIYNGSKNELNENNSIWCNLAIHDTRHRIDITLPMLGFNWVFVDETQKAILFLRNILNIKIVDATE